MDLELIKKAIIQKEAQYKYIVLESMGIAMFIGGLVGLVLGEFYSVALKNIALQILNVFIYGAIGAVIGIFDGKARRKNIQIDLMLLRDFEKRLTAETDDKE